MNAECTPFNSNDKAVENIIVNRARHLFMKVDIKSVSMDDIANACGISKKTLYKCFDKEGLVKTVTQQQVHIFENEIKSILQNNKDVVQELTNLLLFTINASQEISLPFIDSLKTIKPEAYQLILNFTKNIQQTFINNIKKGMSQGYYRSDIVPDVVVQLHFLQLWSLMKQQMLSKSLHWGEELNKMFLFGILSPKGLKTL